MPVGSRFAIEIEWERLERGLPEERATFGAIGMRVDTAWRKLMTLLPDASGRKFIFRVISLHNGSRGTGGVCGGRPSVHLSIGRWPIG